MIYKKQTFGARTAPRIHTRRMGFTRHSEMTAYKSDAGEDGDDLIEKAMKRIEKANETYKNDVIAKAAAEFQKSADELKKYRDATDAKVAELEKSGATILDLQGKVKDMESKQGRILMMNTAASKEKLVDLVVKGIMDHREAIMKVADGAELGAIKFMQKASTITTGSLSGQGIGNYLAWQPGMEPQGQLHFRDLAPIISSDVDTVYYPRANAVNAGGSFAVQVTEYSVKAQIDRAFTMITLNLLPVAGWARVSRQALRNLPFLQSYLPASMNDQLMDAEDIKFHNDLYAAVSGNGLGTVPGTAVLAIEKIVYLITNLIKIKYKPNGIAIDPTVWAEILVTRPASAAFSLPSVVSITPGGTVMILGIPLYPVNWLTGRRVIVADWSKMGVVESEGLTLRQSDNVGTDFTQNAVVFLLERVEGLAIFRTDAIIDTTI